MTHKELGDAWMRSIASRRGLYVTVDTTKGGVPKPADAFNVELGKLVEQRDEV